MTSNPLPPQTVPASQPAAEPISPGPVSQDVPPQGAPSPEAAAPASKNEEKGGLSPFDLAALALLLGAILVLSGISVRQYLINNRVAAPSVLYLMMDEKGANQLYLARLDDSLAPDETILLTEREAGVWDFAPAPEGQVVYSALSEQGMSDLWLYSPETEERERLLACPEASCSNARFGPDGRLVAFTRRNVSDYASAFFSPPRVWLFDPVTGEAAPIFSDGQQLGFEPRWSSDGQRLSFISPDPSGMGVYDLTTGEIDLYPNAMGEAGAWRPESTSLLTTVTWPLEGEYVVHLLEIDVETETTHNLSGEEALVHDSSPVFSPDGEWIGFRRKLLTGEGATRGKQIWVMRADGSQARALTADNGYDFGNVSWSPDGRYLLTRTFPLQGSEIVPKIWLIDVESGETRQLISPGDQPFWLE